MMPGTDGGRSFDFDEDIIYIGRSRKNHFQIRDKFVSRRHLKVFKKENNYLIEDLKSKNGTFINGDQIRPNVRIEVQEGVPIVIGMSVVCLGRACSEDLIPSLESMDLSEELSRSKEAISKERSTTYQKNMELIKKVSEVLMQSSDIDEILEKMLDYITALLERVDRGVIILFDPETKKILKPVSWINKDTEALPIEAYSRSIVDRVLREGKPVIMSDTFSEEEADRSVSMELMRVRSVMCVPLISRSQIRGAIYVDSVNKPRGFRSDDLSLLTALSSSAAIAIDNALLYAREKTETLQ
jgi:hypothetical protein